MFKTESMEDGFDNDHLDHDWNEGWKGFGDDDDFFDDHDDDGHFGDFDDDFWDD